MISISRSRPISVSTSPSTATMTSCSDSLRHSAIGTPSSPDSILRSGCERLTDSNAENGRDSTERFVVVPLEWVHPKTSPFVKAFCGVMAA